MHTPAAVVQRLQYKMHEGHWLWFRAGLAGAGTAGATGAG